MNNLSFCQDTAPIFQYIGKFILIIKIVLPIVIIVLGIIELAKAVTSSDDKALQLAIGSLVKRLIMGIAIFFVTTIVSFVFSLVEIAVPYLEKAEECEACLLHPNDTDCKNYVKIARDSISREGLK